MKKLLAAAALGLLLAGGTLTAAMAEPGPNGSNNHGLCTAYFNGSENGQAHKREAGPFVALASYVGQNDGVDNDGDNTTDESDEVAGPSGIWDWCSNPANTDGKGIGGNPDDPDVSGDTSGRSKPPKN